MAYYTGKGDDGNTSIGRARQPKSDPVFDFVGTLDELNSALGVAASNVEVEELREIIWEVQNDLFSVGADVYFAVSGSDRRVFQGPERLKRLEEIIEKLSKELPPLRSFVIPGGSRASSYLHFARAVCRRAEREAVRASKEASVGQDVIAYLNRLSSLLFVMALYHNKKSGVPERSPTYG